MASVPPSRPIFKSSRQRARRRAVRNVRLVIGALVLLGAGTIAVLLVLALIGGLQG